MVHRSARLRLAQLAWRWAAGWILEQSIALEMLTFAMKDDVLEGMRASREKRAPAFPSVKSPAYQQPPPPPLK